MAPGTPATRPRTGVAKAAAARRPAREELASRFEVVKSRIEAASGGRPVKIVGVTKGFGPDVVRDALDLGLVDLGENYAQSLVAKAEVVPQESICWHFLGAPQTNKISRLSRFVSVWEAVDRERAGEVIARRSPGAAVFVEVNVTGEARRAGCRPAETPHLVENLRNLGLDVRGLMVVGPAGDPAATRTAFSRIAKTNAELELDELSMGMSDDYEEAVRAGATTVRLGRALFGPRPGNAAAQRYAGN